MNVPQLVGSPTVSIRLTNCSRLRRWLIRSATVHIVSPCRAANCLQLRPAGHLAVFPQDLADDGGRLATGQAGQVDAALGLPGPHEHAAVAGPQRVDVPRPQQVLRLGVLGNRHLDRLGPVAGADVPVVTPNLGWGVDGDGERRAELGRC